MDYTILPSENASIRKEENLEMVFSLYETLQELPDTRRAEAQTLLVGVDPVFVTVRQIRGAEEFKWSDWVVASSARCSSRAVWTAHPCMPCHMTYCNVLARVDVVQLDIFSPPFFNDGRRKADVERNPVAC